MLLGKPVKVLLRSKDVVHDFYVPEFRAKMDMIPGMVTFYWFIPTRVGTFDVLVLKLNGTGHYTMRSTVVVDDKDAYKEWLQKQSAFKQSLVETKDRIASHGALPRSARGSRSS